MIAMTPKSQTRTASAIAQSASKRHIGLLQWNAEAQIHSHFVCCDRAATRHVLPLPNQVLLLLLLLPAHTVLLVLY
jgi:hypothetical protein